MAKRKSTDTGRHRYARQVEQQPSHESVDLSWLISEILLQTSQRPTRKAQSDRRDGQG
jgi:hypothetical protein